jgi:hypothetical protein
MNADEALGLLARIEERLVEMEHEIADLRGGHLCEKCSKRDGDAIVGRPGEEVRLVGGYEAILCRECRNAWTVMADESGHWLEYQKAVAREKLVRVSVKIALKRGATSVAENESAAAVARVEDVIAIERKLFQLAAKWLGPG